MQKKRKSWMLEMPYQNNQEDLGQETVGKKPQNNFLEYEYTW